MWKTLIGALVGAIPSIIDAIARNVRARREQQARLREERSRKKKEQQASLEKARKDHIKKTAAEIEKMRSHP